MSFEQSQSANDRVNLNERQTENNPQLNLVDLQHGERNWGQDSSRDNGTAEKHLPGLSLNHGDQNSSMNSNDGSVLSPIANNGSATEATMSNTTQTRSSNSDGNILQNISSTLQTDLTNFEKVAQQFTTDLASAENSLGLGSNQNQDSGAGSENSGTSSDTGSGAQTFKQQLQALMNYLGMPGNSAAQEQSNMTPTKGADAPVVSSTSAKSATIPAATSTDNTTPAATNTDNTTPAATNTDNTTPAATNTDNTTPAATNTDNTTPAATNTDNTTPAATNTDNTTPAATNTDNTTPAATNTDNTTPAATNTDNTTPAATNTDNTTPAATNTDNTTPAATNNATNNNGLYVQGNQLMDNGTPFVPAGINDTESTEHDELTNSMGQIASEGANTVRLMGQASDLSGGPNNAFNQEVQSALNAGLKVDIAYNSDEAIYGDTGGVLSSSDLSEASNALSSSAAEWGNNPNVMYNVTNESGVSGDANNPTLLSNTETLIGAVQAGAKSTNPNANPVTVVDDSEWGQGAFDSNYQQQSFLYNNASALEAAGNGQVVGGVHDYQGDSSYTNQGVEAIQAEGMPVFTEEFGGNNTADYSLAEQTSSVTGEPIGGLVWNDGTDPTTGNFYNNILNDSNLAPQVQNFWSSLNSEAAAASPNTDSTNAVQNDQPSAITAPSPDVATTSADVAPTNDQPSVAPTSSTADTTTTPTNVAQTGDFPDPTTNPDSATELAALNQADPQLVQMIQDMGQNGMSQAGLSTVENGLYSKWYGHDYLDGGAYTSPVYNTSQDITGGLAYEFSVNGPEGTLSSSDSNIFNNTVANDISQNGNQAINLSLVSSS